MSCQVSPETVEKMHKMWRGNGGRKSLFNIAKQFNLELNETYAILATPFAEAMLRARRNKSFISLPDNANFVGVKNDYNVIG